MRIDTLSTAEPKEILFHMCEEIEELLIKMPVISLSISGIIEESKNSEVSYEDIMALQFFYRNIIDELKDIKDSHFNRVF